MGTHTHTEPLLFPDVPAAKSARVPGRSPGIRSSLPAQGQELPLELPDRDQAANPGISVPN